MSDVLVLHHFTTPEAFEAIRTSRIIRASRQARVSHGPGVYLTKRTPFEHQKTIAGNNWGDGVSNEDAILAMGKVDCCYQICIPQSDPKIRQVQSGERDIYLYSGDIHLDNFKHTRITVGAKGQTVQILDGTFQVQGKVTVRSGTTLVLNGGTMKIG